MTRSARAVRLAAATSIGALTVVALSACGAAGNPFPAAGDKQVTVLMVNNPQMTDLQKLTVDTFTKDTGIAVKYTVLPENDVRAKISQEFSSQAGLYDVASLSNYEVPAYAANGWLSPLDETVAASESFDQDDILSPMTSALTVDGKLYAEPFYGESSVLMYRRDVFEAEGLTMPEAPTWPQIAALAEQVDGAEPDMKGICLRGQPGWGQLFAPLTTVVNTFGGTWFDEDWNAQVDSPEFLEATQFYVDLVRAHGESGAAQAGYTECLNALTQSKVAMWYDSTAAAGTLEADGSPVAGSIGYVAAPVVDTASSGWLYTWAFAIQKAGKNQEAAAEFIAWASSKEYEELVGQEIGWSSVPAGKRSSTYENPDYQAAAAPFYAQTEAAISSVDAENPGLQPRPAPGVQFVAVPEFADMATQVSQEISAAIAGKQTVEEALAKGQVLAEKVSARYQE